MKKIKSTPIPCFSRMNNFLAKTSLIYWIQKGNIFFGGRACFGWVGRSTANQIFLRSVQCIKHELTEQYSLTESDMTKHGQSPTTSVDRTIKLYSEARLN